MHILTCEELIDILAQKAREALDAGGEHSNYGVVRYDSSSQDTKLFMVKCKWLAKNSRIPACQFVSG